MNRRARSHARDRRRFTRARTGYDVHHTGRVGSPAAGSSGQRASPVASAPSRSRRRRRTAVGSASSARQASFQTVASSAQIATRAASARCRASSVSRSSGGARPLRSQMRSITYIGLSGHPRRRNRCAGLRRSVLFHRRTSERIVRQPGWERCVSSTRSSSWAGSAATSARPTQTSSIRFVSSGCSPTVSTSSSQSMVCSQSGDSSMRATVPSALEELGFALVAKGSRHSPALDRMRWSVTSQRVTVSARAGPLAANAAAMRCS